MAWTYDTYLGTTYGISVGLVLITILLVFLTLLCTRDLIALLVNSVIGIDLEDAEDPDTSDINVYHVKVNKETPRYRAITILLYIITGLILSIMPVLIFEGCVLTNSYLLPSDSCPDDPVDCFVFANASASQTIATFSCIPGNSTQFPSNYSDAHASCFGWIIRRQTTRKVLDQVGICAGLIGLFGVFLTFTVHVARQKVQIAYAIIIVSLVIFGAVIILMAYFRWALSFLTFAVLGLCMTVFIFGPVLAILVPKKRGKTTKVEQMNPHSTDSPVVQQRPKSQVVTNVSSANRFQKKTQVYPAFE